MQRVSAAIFLVAFFSALPLYGLSSQRGWITVTGTRLPSGRFQTEIIRRDAFSTRTEQYEVVGARVHFSDVLGRRPGPVVLTLETGYGPRELLSEEVGTVAAVPQVTAKLKQHADVINSDVDQFHFVINPEVSFWVMCGLVVLFALAGLGIARSDGRKPPGSR